MRVNDPQKNTEKKEQRWKIPNSGGNTCGMSENKPLLNKRKQQQKQTRFRQNLTPLSSAGQKRLPSATPN